MKIDLGTLGGPGSQALGVNSALTIVGVSDQASPKPPTAFIWTPGGGMRTLRFGDNSQATAISDRARSAGFRVGTGVTGLTQIGGVTTILPNLAPAKGHFSAPTAVNLCGTMVGSGASPVPTNGNSIPVIWKNSTCD